MLTAVPHLPWRGHHPSLVTTAATGHTVTCHLPQAQDSGSAGDQPQRAVRLSSGGWLAAALVKSFVSSRGHACSCGAPRSRLQQPKSLEPGSGHLHVAGKPAVPASSPMQAHPWGWESGERRACCWLRVCRANTAVSLSQKSRTVPFDLADELRGMHLNLLKPHASL